MEEGEFSEADDGDDGSGINMFELMHALNNAAAN